jgi:8-oxo-dGTP pyrophosphatase MutT (NUDIX family)
VSAGPTSGRTAGSTETVIPAPAATVVLLRPGPGAIGPEILLTHRPTTMAFAGGMHVFPGGRVDPADTDPGIVARSARRQDDAAHALGDNVTPGEALALHVAAIRELFEEAGVLLADTTASPQQLADARRRLLGGASLSDSLDGLDVRLRTDQLAPIAHWTTPRFMTRRFSTWFFAADLPPGAKATFESEEVIGHRWVSATTALDQLAAGQIEMWVPTSTVVQRLVEIGASDATELGRRLDVGPTAPPRVVDESLTVVRLLFGAVGALPGRNGTTTLFGRRELVLIDPGDPSDAAIDMIDDVVRRRDAVIRAIVLTTTDPDHAAGAEAIAIPLEIPILLAPGAGRHLPYQTRELADGERLPADVDVRARLAPPGSGRVEVVSGSAGQ